MLCIRTELLTKGKLFCARNLAINNARLPEFPTALQICITINHSYAFQRLWSWSDMCRNETGWWMLTRIGQVVGDVNEP